MLKSSGRHQAGDEFCCDGPTGEQLVAEGAAEIIGAKVRLPEPRTGSVQGKERKDDTGDSTDSRTRKPRRSKAASQG
jgi:hypothetical protein